jgi:MFS family permease
MISAWRWLFIIEGSFSIFLGGICWLTFPTSPDTAWFLTPEEKELMAKRKERNAAFRGDDKFDKKWAKIALRDPFMYLASIAFFFSSVAIFGFGTFLPTIIKGLGYVHGFSFVGNANHG